MNMHDFENACLGRLPALTELANWVKCTVLAAAALASLNASAAPRSPATPAIAQTAKLAPTSALGASGAPFEQFGTDIAVDGDTAVVTGALERAGPNELQCFAYVFVRKGATWTPQAKLFAVGSVPTNGNSYRPSAALSGHTAAIGCGSATVGSNVAQGSVSVFVRNGSAWAHQARLAAFDGSSGSGFGGDVALDGDTLVVGARNDAAGGVANRGATYVYTRFGTGWSQQAKLVAADGAADDQFGIAVAVSADTVAVGAAYHDVNSLADHGASYVFVRAAGQWVQQAMLVREDGSASDHCGRAIDIDGGVVMVGCPLSDAGSNGDQGSVDVFARSAGTWARETRLFASDGAIADEFGCAVAVSGDAAVVGACEHDVGGISNRGAAYVFARSGGNWTQHQKLLSAGGENLDEFGSAVAISEGRALVGDPNLDLGSDYDQGAVLAFARSGSAWLLEDRFDSGDGRVYDGFGWAVAMDSDTAIVGAQLDEVGDTSDQGAAYVYRRESGIWALQARLTSSDGAARDAFGQRVALVGNTAFAAAPSDDVGNNANQGSVYVFVRSGTSWAETARLVAPGGTPGERFGAALAASEDMLVVGAPDDGAGANFDAGSAYIFQRVDGEWIQRARLVASDRLPGDQFGRSVALSGSTVVVGAHSGVNATTSDRGSAYVFVNRDGSWTQQAKLVEIPFTPQWDFFGHSVSISGERLIVGSPRHEVGSTQFQGASYVFVRDGESWTLEAKLLADDGAGFDAFGSTVALRGNLAIVAATGSGGPGANYGGAVYVFDRNGNRWLQRTKILSSDLADEDLFGSDMQLFNDQLIVGAAAADGALPFGRPDEGAAYIFEGIRADLLFGDGYESR